MASYTYTAAAVYTPTGTKLGADLPGGTINDGSPAGAFTTAGPGASFTVSGQNVDYSGTASVGGLTYPVGVITTGPAAGNVILFVEGVPTPPTLPAAVITPGANFTVCFAAGTEIATPEGFTLVEDLKIGDMVRTFDGRDVAVKWLGRQTVAPRFMPAERVRPVRIASGALGGGLPTSDLTVTSDHALLLGDTLCSAGALVNGTTITRVPLDEMGESYTVYHVETDAHEILLANGAAAETFIDNVSRKVFDNFDEFEARYGEVAEMDEMAYPRATSARQVPRAIVAGLQPQTAA